MKRRGPTHTHTSQERTKKGREKLNHAQMNVRITHPVVNKIMNNNFYFQPNQMMKHLENYGRVKKSGKQKRNIDIIDISI
jgi:hypothetical protein